MFRAAYDTAMYVYVLEKCLHFNDRRSCLRSTVYVREQLPLFVHIYAVTFKSMKDGYTTCVRVLVYVCVCASVHVSVVISSLIALVKRRLSLFCNISKM